MYKRSLLTHMRCINECLPRFGAHAVVNVQNFQLEARGRGRYYHLTPQFTYNENGKIRYSTNLRNNVVAFVGWLPYYNKRWPLAIDKMAFKDFCRANGLATPDHWTHASEETRNFIVKQRLSSFGYGIRGPFESVDASDDDHRLKNDDYYERFVPGTIAKAWYWESKLVCLELHKMPVVSGDGARTFLELVAARVLHPYKPPGPDEFAQLARYQHIAPEDVVPSGTSLLADFRYNSVLFPISSANPNVLAEHENTQAGAQFRDAGPVFWQGIPEEMRAMTLFSIDAIVDDAEKVWFLEMNCNPMINPDCYFPMFESMFGPPESAPRAPPMGMPPSPS